MEAIISLKKAKILIISLVCALMLSLLLGEVENRRLSSNESSLVIAKNQKQIAFLESLFQSITLTLNQTAELYNGICSDNLKMFMRKSIFNIDGVIELGIIQNESSQGMLVCNSWGNNNLQMRKPKNHDGFLFSGPHTSNMYEEKIFVIKKTVDDYEFNALIKHPSTKNLLQSVKLSTDSNNLSLKPMEKETPSNFISNLSYVYQYKAVVNTSGLFYASTFLLSFALFQLLVTPYLIFTLDRSNLKRRIMRGDFFNVYQPIIDASDGKVFSYEIFTRAKGHDNALSIIKNIKHYNLHVEHTLQQLDKLEEEKAQLTCQNFQVNLSAKHLVDDRLIHYLSKVALSSRKEIIIEITEDEDLFKHRLKVKEAMRKLRELGYRFALDDFGAGFSNFSYVFEFEFDLIKIDKSVLKFENIELLLSLVRVFDTLKMPCIIEGVEDDTDKKKLDLIDIKYHQGWLYGKPEKAPQDNQDSDLQDASSKSDN
ncbi:EAL domain-containing protein [Marinomonas sp. 5E14-1]|uniref:EAL domain-containing protein n=1 Tax=Marinomonas sp. 5E14-1 TaxID=3153922 RepID=UPI0032672CED